MVLLQEHLHQCVLMMGRPNVLFQSTCYWLVQYCASKHEAPHATGRCYGEERLNKFACKAQVHWRTEAVQLPQTHYIMRASEQYLIWEANVLL